MRIRKRTTGRLTTAALVLTLGAAAPVGASQATGTVGASVTVAGPEACLLVGTEHVAFPDTIFGETVRSPKPYTVSTCADAAVPQTLYARATDATGDNATWELTEKAAGPDRFQVEVAFPDTIFFPDDYFLGRENRRAGTLGPDNPQATMSHRLVMPTEGDGTGETMRFDIVWTAVADAPEPK